MGGECTVQSGRPNLTALVQGELNDIPTECSVNIVTAGKQDVSHSSSVTLTGHPKHTSKLSSQPAHVSLSTAWVKLTAGRLYNDSRA